MLDVGPPRLFGPEMAHVGEFVGEHDDAVADLQLGMADAVAHRQPELLGRSERTLVELDRRIGVVDDQIGRDAVIAFGNGLRHVISPVPARAPFTAFA